MESTVFSKIANHEVPAHIIWEDDSFIAFLDVLPIAPGHVIVAPRQPFASLEDMPDGSLGNFFVVAQKIGKAFLTALGAEGYSLFLDNKNGANQRVPHVHFHVLPRAADDGLGRWPQNNAYADGEAEEYTRKLRGVIS